ncbi:MAG: response regulator, partial [Bdellovibrionales bacterium]
MGSFVTGGSSEGKPKVLIVDDEVQLAQTLSDILKLRGFDPDTAHDGLQAKKKLMSESFRIVITDIRMPRMDGSTLLAYIQEHHPR